MATQSLSPSSDHHSTSSSHAEALLNKARQLSSDAYERSRAAPPLSFAEGEDINLSSPTLRPVSPYLSPNASRSSASLHQLHRNSFNELIRDHGRRRSSQAQRQSSLSSMSSKTPSPLSSEFPSDITSPTITIGNTSTSLSESTTTTMGLMRISQQTSQGITIEPSPGDCPSIHDDYKDSDCPTIQTQGNSPQTSLFNAHASATHPTTLLKTLPTAAHRKHRSDIGGGDGYIKNILGALRENEQGSSGTPLQSLSSSTLTPQPSGTPFASSTTYALTTDTPQDQPRITQQMQTISRPMSTPTLSTTRLHHHQIQANTLSEKDTLEQAPITVVDASAIQMPSLDQISHIQRDSCRSDIISSQEKAPESHSRDSSSQSLQPPVVAKKERRASKLFGKLMPKFLHTSSSSSSQKEASLPSPQSPLSDSQAPFSSGSGKHSVRIRSSSASSNGNSIKSTLNSDGVCKKTTLPSLNEPTSPTLPELPEFALGMDNDWFTMKSKLDAEGSVKEPLYVAINTTTISIESPPTPTSTMAPYSPITSSSLYSFKFDEAIEPISESPEDLELQHSSSYFKVKVEADYENGETEAKEAQEHMYNVEVEADYSSYSPYTIDENCDDDFFLNSVLRKKTRPQSTLPLISTGTGWSLGRTPSLSTSFTSSSQASSTVPSPTSAFAPMSYIPSSTPMINLGLDEKRSRLSDAVKEWRRSTNSSVTSSYSMAYSGFSA
ncbi:hypothetical protein BGX27_009327 [Mortierella sp. AM989]|nr:hypothetical protein BGX27_009327 [Mortierella sp. AM989]